MSQRPEYIQLEANDDLAHIRDRLSFIRGRRVLLIWPENGTALTRKLDLVLVQREAKRRAIQIALVTHDKQVAQNAHDLGISTFETINASDTARWKRGRTKVFTQRHHKPEDEPEPQELMDVASRVRNPVRRVARWRYVLERLVIVAILVGVVALTTFVVVPSATVTLKVAQETLTTSTTITADPTLTDVNVEQAIIPATILRAEVQTNGTTETTGISALGDNPAIGVVLFTNLTTNRVDIPANTIVSTSAGTPLKFKTISDTSVRGGFNERAEVAIEALPEYSGDQSNVGAGTINVIEGDLANSVSVINLSATTGGETRSFASVSQSDQDRLLAIVRGQLQATAYGEMQASLSDTQIIVIETIRIAEERNDWTTYNVAVGDISDTLSLQMRAIVEAVVIDDRYARQIVFAQLSAQRPSGKILQADTFAFTRGAVTQIDNNTVVFSASGEVLANAQIDTTRLAEQLVGKSVPDAQAYLLSQNNLDASRPPLITITPDWFTQLPFLPIRISIQTVSN
jgi:hypothetical protein